MRTIIDGYPKDHMRATLEGILTTYPNIEWAEIEEKAEYANVKLVLKKDVKIES